MGSRAARGQAPGAADDDGQTAGQHRATQGKLHTKVEHVFHIVKNLFGMKKVPDPGWAKNTAQLYTLFGLANRLIAKRRLCALNGQGAS